MINATIFILGFIFFYCMLLWLDKKKQKRKEAELNSIRKIQFKPRKIEAKLPASMEPIGSLPVAFRYVGDYNPKEVYKDGDVVFKDMNYYVWVKGRLELLGEMLYE